LFLIPSFGILLIFVFFFFTKMLPDYLQFGKLKAATKIVRQYRISKNAKNFRNLIVKLKRLDAEKNAKLSDTPSEKSISLHSIGTSSEKILELKETVSKVSVEVQAQTKANPVQTPGIASSEVN
jgi:DNA-directed RNA polymerase sigma subunit (sigma70/sigma32)